MPLHSKAVEIIIPKCYEILRTARACLIDEIECFILPRFFESRGREKNGS